MINNKSSANIFLEETIDCLETYACMPVRLFGSLNNTVRRVKKFEN